jgi:hypothetical protein
MALLYCAIDHPAIYKNQWLSATFKSPLKFPESQYIIEHFPIKDVSRLCLQITLVEMLGNLPDISEV